MNKKEMEKALAKYGKATGRDSVQPWDVRNILRFGVKKYILITRKIRPGETDLSDMDLSGLEMCDMYFGCEDTLADAILIGANMAGTIFEGTLLGGVDFSWANLRGSDFNGCDLEGACFENANLQGATFYHCYMSGCKLTEDCGATFIDCVGLPWTAAETEAKRWTTSS